MGEKENKIWTDFEIAGVHNSSAKFYFVLYIIALEFVFIQSTPFNTAFR